ncbi:hypothetical protein HFK83_18030 [Ralstonia pseudosolanacearum]|uniref:hypothetical protein n=1 Tax=Ralstonia solanacearum species complex TaxID=3116862 RepID=UPI001146D3DF|nr:hypothetical protein [Ralstonia pseudosolanacearum]MCK4124258.1 hypothetical protein [Ralstonia pseudosolanacearum]
MNNQLRIILSVLYVVLYISNANAQDSSLQRLMKINKDFSETIQLPAIQGAVTTPPRAEEVPKPTASTSTTAVSPPPATSATSSRTITSAQYAEGGQEDFFQHLVQQCSIALNVYDSRAQQQRTRSEGIAIAGALLGVTGAALAGHAAAAVVAGLSGLSGAANTTQKIFQDNGDTSATTIEARENVRKNALAAINSFTGAKDDVTRIAALNQLYSDCMLLDPVGVGK